MFYPTLLAAATAFAGMVSAQYYSTSGPLMINPNDVDPQLRQSWCIGQQNSCEMLCSSTTPNGNQCNPQTLNYTCVCTSGAMPNISDYAATMPSYICAQWRADCTNAHPNDAIGQAGCQSVVCGSKNASEAEVASSSSTASASSGASSTAMTTSASTSSAASSTSASAAAASSTHASSAAAVMNVVKQYGTGIFATGLFAIFGLVL